MEYVKGAYMVHFLKFSDYGNKEYKKSNLGDIRKYTEIKHTTLDKW